MKKYNERTLQTIQSFLPKTSPQALWALTEWLKRQSRAPVQSATTPKTKRLEMTTLTGPAAPKHLAELDEVNHEISTAISRLFSMPTFTPVNNMFLAGKTLLTHLHYPKTGPFKKEKPIQYLHRLDLLICLPGTMNATTFITDLRHRTEPEPTIQVTWESSFEIVNPCSGIARKKLNLVLGSKEDPRELCLHVFECTQNPIQALYSQPNPSSLFTKLHAAHCKIEKNLTLGPVWSCNQDLSISPHLIHHMIDRTLNQPINFRLLKDLLYSLLQNNLYFSQSSLKITDSLLYTLIISMETLENSILSALTAEAETLKTSLISTTNFDLFHQLTASFHPHILNTDIIKIISVALKTLTLNCCIFERRKHESRRDFYAKMKKLASRKINYISSLVGNETILPLYHEPLKIYKLIGHPCKNNILPAAKLCRAFDQYGIDWLTMITTLLSYVACSMMGGTRVQQHHTLKQNRDTEIFRVSAITTHTLAFALNRRPKADDFILQQYYIQLILKTVQNIPLKNLQYRFLQILLGITLSSERESLSLCAHLFSARTIYPQNPEIQDHFLNIREQLKYLIFPNEMKGPFVLTPNRSSTRSELKARTHALQTGSYQHLDDYCTLYVRAHSTSYHGPALFLPSSPHLKQQFATLEERFILETTELLAEFESYKQKNKTQKKRQKRKKRNRKKKKQRKTNSPTQPETAAPALDADQNERGYKRLDAFVAKTQKEADSTEHLSTLIALLESLNKSRETLPNFKRFLQLLLHHLFAVIIKKKSRPPSASPLEQWITHPCPANTAPTLLTIGNFFESINSGQRKRHKPQRRIELAISLKQMRDHSSSTEILEKISTINHLFSALTQQNQCFNYFPGLLLSLLKEIESDVNTAIEHFSVGRLFAKGRGHLSNSRRARGPKEIQPLHLGTLPTEVQRFADETANSALEHTSTPDAEAGPTSASC